MKRIIAGHSCNAFLKPGEVIISANPVLVSTVLGSCVAITLYSNEKRVGAICHAMLPNNLKQEDNLLYVDTAVHYLHRKMIEYGAGADLIVKLFGGAQVMVGGQSTDIRQSVGEQNIAQAKKVLEQLGLVVAKEDIGGKLGRKLLFSIKTGDVYLRRLKSSGNEYLPGGIS
ncbi:MAG: chemotaxis protein CheD [Desulfobulbaceae bacterium]|nr:chemotaxis protein CheD [Desulfobulbaceae bacterium]